MHSKVSAGQSWMVSAVSPATIQNYRAKMTEKGPKRAQIESNIAFMSPNALHNVLICISLHHRVIRWCLLLYLLILRRFMLRFRRKSAFFWKMPFISGFYICVRAPRRAARRISLRKLIELV